MQRKYNLKKKTVFETTGSFMENCLLNNWHEQDNIQEVSIEKSSPHWMSQHIISLGKALILVVKCDRWNAFVGLCTL